MRCECQNCGFSDDSEKLPLAKDVLLRHSLGDAFSDVECPKCGALCVPIVRDDETEYSEMALAEWSAEPPTAWFELTRNVGEQKVVEALPASILKVQTKGREWVIEGAGRAKYVFRLLKISRIVPNPNLLAVKIPDSTPEIISAYALSDEQALLAKVRYNRLIDIFLGIACYSLQNHLRTTVKSIGQIEIDEVYIGINQKGAQFVIPVQAKGGTDRLAMVQTKQDIECCLEKFPDLICRAISTQFITDDLIALFELTVDGGELKVVEERHYQLVPAVQISSDDLRRYAGN